MAHHHAEEAIEYVDHELLTNRFHVTHYGRYTVLCNKDTFFPDVKVTSIYLYDNRHDLQKKYVKEKQAGSCKVCQHVLLFGDNLPAAEGSLSWHISNNYDEKRGIGKKLLLTIRGSDV